MHGKLWSRRRGPGLAVAVLGAAAPSPSLLPPTPAPLPVTSSFGEYRQGHYHGGLDFSTGGREGVPVQAPQDGFVFRLRTSGVGYGRVVYFRQEDGRTVLYAHLSRFDPRIQALVESVQDRERRYEVDFRPEPGTVTYRAGEILGYSGQSGAGPPHLHAEMRVGEDAAVAVNPLGQGWSVADTVAPRITRLCLEPAVPGALVNGGVDPLVIPAAPSPSPVEVSGPFRLWAECGDRAVPGSHRLAPRVVRAYLDASLECEVRLDRFHWNWAREVEWTFDNARARADDERWITLEPAPGSRQEVARGDPRWTHALSPGRYRLRVEAEDGNGNRTAVAVPLVAATGGGVLRSPRIERTELASRGAFLEVRVPGPAAADVLAETEDGTRAHWMPLPAPGGTVFQLGEPSAPGPWRIILRREDADSVLGRALYVPEEAGSPGMDGAAPGRFEAGGCVLSIGPASTYGPLWITIRTEAEVPAGPLFPELEPVGGCLRLGPWAWPLRERIGITMAFPDGGSRRGVGVFSRSKRGWSFEGADTTGRGVGADLASLEDVALFRDGTPPAVRIEPPAAGARTVTARILDGGVGVTWRDIAMTLDGRALVAEWDPEGERLTGHLRRTLDPGKHTVVVLAADRVGNRTVERLAFSAGQ